MSKTDDLRAMREARYLANQARGGAPKPAPKPAQRLGASKDPQPAAAEPVPAGERLCGHRAISGRTCTRELGHAAKSHRYS
jgi:hypothetical protein